jgi:hypothetical protein
MRYLTLKTTVADSCKIVPKNSPENMKQANAQKEYCRTRTTTHTKKNLKMFFIAIMIISIRKILFQLL